MYRRMNACMLWAAVLPPFFVAAERGYDQVLWMLNELVSRQTHAVTLKIGLLDKEMAAFDEEWGQLILQGSKIDEVRGTERPLTDSAQGGLRLCRFFGDVLRPTARRAQEVAAEYRGGSARGREGPAGVMPSLQQMAAGKARMRNTPQVRSSVPPDAPPFPKGISEFPSRGQIVLPGRGVSSRVADARPGPTPARPVADSPPTSNPRFRVRSAHTPLPSLSRPDRGDPHDGGPARGEG